MTADYLENVLVSLEHQSSAIEENIISIAETFHSFLIIQNILLFQTQYAYNCIEN